MQRCSTAHASAGRATGTGDEDDQRTPPATLASQASTSSQLSKWEHPLRAALHRRLQRRRGVHSDEARLDAEVVDHPQRPRDHDGRPFPGTAVRTRCVPATNAVMPRADHRILAAIAVRERP